MSSAWYILHTYSAYEAKISRTVQHMLEMGELDSNIVKSIKVPEEEVFEIKDGKKKSRKTKILPSYIMMELDLPDLGWKDTCAKIRRIQGVNGFVGTKPNERPRPIPVEEAKRMLARAGEIKGEKVVRVKQSYAVGDIVKIMEGPFATFEGTVEKIEDGKDKLTVNVQIFGRATPVEVSMTQVEKSVK